MSRSPTIEEVIRTALTAFGAELRVSLPGKIINYDQATQTASVKPLLKNQVPIENDDPLVEALPIIEGVTVMFPRAGGYFLSFPVQAGDPCHIVFVDRSLDQWSVRSTGEDVDPQDGRQHNISDAVCYMGMAPPAGALSDADADDLVIGQDGGTRIHIKPDEIALGEKAPGDRAVLNSKLQDELARLKADMDALKLSYDLHTHLGVTSGAQATAPPTTPAPTPSSPGDTHSDTVTLK